MAHSEDSGVFFLKITDEGKLLSMFVEFWHVFSFTAWLDRKNNFSLQGDSPQLSETKMALLDK